MEMLEIIVEYNDKKRYSFNEDKTKIRANQGHTIDVDVELEQMTPPDYLFHGTGSQNKESIDREGLKPMGRLYVHLSADPGTAIKVGQRHAKPIVYTVDCEQMAREGYLFYRSVNGVWLTEEVPAEYLELEG